MCLLQPKEWHRKGVGSIDRGQKTACGPLNTQKQNYINKLPRQPKESFWMVNLPSTKLVAEICGPHQMCREMQSKVDAEGREYMSKAAAKHYKKGRRNLKVLKREVEELIAALCNSRCNIGECDSCTSTAEKPPSAKHTLPQIVCTLQPNPVWSGKAWLDTKHVASSLHL